jgi:hypothetical protein
MINRINVACLLLALTQMASTLAGLNLACFGSTKGENFCVLSSLRWLSDKGEKIKAQYASRLFQNLQMSPHAHTLW